MLLERFDQLLRDGRGRFTIVPDILECASHVEQYGVDQAVSPPLCWFFYKLSEAHTTL